MRGCCFLNEQLIVARVRAQATGFAHLMDIRSRIARKVCGLRALLDAFWYHSAGLRC